MLKFALISLMTTLFISCTSNFAENMNLNEEDNSTEIVEVSKSQTILNKTIHAHGGDLYNVAHYSFEFRGNTYKFRTNDHSFEYTKTETRTDTIITDVLNNNEFSQLINNSPIVLSEKEIESKTGALNSVIYFATLPYKLNDKAVNTNYIGSTLIKEQNYHTIEITFDQAGGGEDHDDEYYYWINSRTYSGEESV